MPAKLDEYERWHAMVDPVQDAPLRRWLGFVDRGRARRPRRGPRCCSTTAARRRPPRITRRSWRPHRRGRSAAALRVAGLGELAAPESVDCAGSIGGMAGRHLWKSDLDRSRMVRKMAVSPARTPNDRNAVAVSPLLQVSPRPISEASFVAKERVERDEEDLVRLYLTDIGQYPLLTKDDEVRLAQQIEAGNAARAELADRWQARSRRPRSASCARSVVRATTPSARSCSRTCASWSRSRRSTRRRACRSST